MTGEGTTIWLFVITVLLSVIGVFAGWLWIRVQSDIRRAHQRTDQLVAENHSLELAVEKQKSEIMEKVNNMLTAGLVEVKTELTVLRASMHTDIGHLREEFGRLSGIMERAIEQDRPPYKIDRGGQ